LITIEAFGMLGMVGNFNLVEHFLFAPILIGMVLYYIYLLYNDTSENIMHFVLLGSFFAAIGILVAMPIAVAWDYSNTHTGGISNLAKLSYYKIGVVLEIICFSIGLIKRAKNEQDKLRNAEMEVLRLGNEQSKYQLKLLWSQLHSHVLYNFLTHAKAEIQQKNFETAKNYIEEFSRFLREVLGMSRSQVVSIQKELSFCKYYLSLEKRRLDNKFEYKVYCEVSEDLLFYLKIPPFSIQPFLENAIKHGIRKNGMIIVSTFRRGNRLICRVEDNGVGRKASKAMQKGMIDNHMSVGIEIIRERLGLIGINMRIIDLTNEKGNPKGTAVELIFNLDENEL
jgi:sensor histidine kinase YesM